MTLCLFSWQKQQGRHVALFRENTLSEIILFPNFFCPTFPNMSWTKFIWSGNTGKLQNVCLKENPSDVSSQNK